MKPNIVLITADTLRYDTFSEEHMPLTYGWAKQNSVIFHNCYANSSWTRTSFGSLLTGLVSSKHGSIRNCPTRQWMLDKKTLYDEPVKAKTLPELLTDYFKICIQGNHTIYYKDYGFSNGFNLYLSTYKEDEVKFYPDARSITHLALATLNRYYHNIPQFIWVNYMDMHCPYGAELVNPKFKAEPEFTSNEKIELRKLYEDDAACLDIQLFRLLSIVANNAILIFTSDHGEEFFEHGDNILDENFYNRGVDHGHTMYEELLHVPLFISDMHNSTGSNSNLVSLVDIGATMFDFAGVEPLDIDGVSLMNSYPECVFSESVLYGQERKSLIFSSSTKDICQVITSKDNEPEQVIIKGNNCSYNNLLDKASELAVKHNYPLFDFPEISFDNSMNEDKHTEKILKGLGYL